MNPQEQHAFEPDEIMAYLDGELAPVQALEVATHLDHCAECARLAEGIRSTSSQMREWTVEAPSPQMGEVALSTLKRFPAPAQKKNLISWVKDWWHASGWIGLAKSPYSWVVGCLVLAACLTLGSHFLSHSQSENEVLDAWEQMQQLGRVHVPAATKSSRSNPVASPAPSATQGEPIARIQYEAANQLETNESEAEGEGAGGGNAPALSAVTTPMIAQTASVTIVPANYEQASASLEALAKTHGGYLQKLDASAQAGQARSVSATLRIPAAQLGDFLSEAKKLGRVVQFSQENEEVTDQYVDVTARLKSARTTEQRLIELQSTRTGKLSDVLEVERELERVRGEIEQMQGEQAVLVHRVQYASVDLSLQEEYRENLHSESTSKLTTIWNAVVEGFRNLENGIVSLLVFLLAYGPSILFWLAIVGVPAWLIWRRRHRAQSPAK